MEKRTTGWTFEVPGSPVPKERPRVGRAGGLSAQQKLAKALAAKTGEPWTDPRRTVIRTPKRTTSYEMQVAAAAQEAGVMVGEGPCFIWIGAWLPPGSRADLDNIAKSVLDGLVLAGKAALADDSADIVRRLTIERIGVDAVAPRLHVAIWLLE